MQKMLVTLVLVLTTAVGGLAIWTYDLWSELDQRPARLSTGARGGADLSHSVAPERVDRLEKRLAKAVGTIERLERELAEARRAARTRTERAGGGGDGSDGPSDLGSVDGGAPFPAPERGPEGEFRITEEEEEYFLALQERVQKRRRIDGMTRITMRRIDRLASDGRINALGDDVRDRVEKVVEKYVARGDDVIDKYVRNQSDEVRAMDAQMRADAMRTQRDLLKEEALRELTPVVGPDDAQAIAESAFRNPWGGRLRRGRRGDRSR